MGKNTDNEITFTHYIRSGQKQLRCGYTTGTCAALAAAGAVRLLLTGKTPETMGLTTPKGLFVEVPLREVTLHSGTARAAVAKDGGDDADVTDGLLIWAAVSYCEGTDIRIDGGEGVGRVTKPGLDQPVGAAAINRVPRAMIEAAVAAERKAAGFLGGISVVISVPGGETLAQRTFNPILGVMGGISILGTSGIVEPMSQQAIVDTIAVELRQAAATGARRIVLTPGNYGLDFLKNSDISLNEIEYVKCSNFIGETLDIAAAEGFSTVLLVGHIGKLVKLAGGIMNTHSRYADCRMELLCAHAAACGADTALCCALLDAATTDAAMDLLRADGLWEAVLARLLDAIQRHLNRRADGAFRVGAVLFSNESGLLGRTVTAQEIMKEWERQ